jgi:hypothetical protein
MAEYNKCRLHCEMLTYKPLTNSAVQEELDIFFFTTWTKILKSSTIIRPYTGATGTESVQGYRLDEVICTCRWG